MLLPSKYKFAAGFFQGDCPCCPAGEDTPWTGTEGQKAYLTSGQFSSTISKSKVVNAGGNSPQGISWDGIDTFIVNNATSKFFRYSGQFTTTVRDSEGVSGGAGDQRGITWDGTNTAGCGASSDRMFLYSAKFTSTLIKSISVTSTQPTGVSWDGTDMFMTAGTGDKMIRYSGQFTTTVRDSEGGNNQMEDLSWDGTNTVYCERRAISSEGKLMLQSAKFGSVIKKSQSVYSIDTAITGVNTNKRTTG